MNIIFVTADLTVHAGVMAAAGKSGGCGYPTATQWRVTESRQATADELAEHADLISALTAEVAPRRYWFTAPGIAGRWAIRSAELLHARIGWLATGQQEWGRTRDEFQFLEAA
mgnify:CR=1 FL=1